jgi:hypothetical protein
MTTFYTFLTYFGATCLALTFLYGVKDYVATIFGGFVAFCVFYFSFGVKDFEWTFSSIAPHVKDAAIIYAISCVIAIIIYKLFPAKPTGADILPE